MNAAELDDNSVVAQYVAKYNQQLQILLDRAAPQTLPRWALWSVSLLVYVLRVWFLRGFYIVTYGLGIYNLNLLLGFITPQVDPELEVDGPALPTKSDQEFKPFVRRLPEFKFWCAWLGRRACLSGGSESAVAGGGMPCPLPCALGGQWAAGRRQAVTVVVSIGLRWQGRRAAPARVAAKRQQPPTNQCLAAAAAAASMPSSPGPCPCVHAPATHHQVVLHQVAVDRAGHDAVPHV